VVRGPEWIPRRLRDKWKIVKTGQTLRLRKAHDEWSKRIHRGPYNCDSALHLTLVHDEVLGRGRRPRDGGRRVVLGPAFGVVFSVSLTPEED
jgi:hypothetical protein